MPSPGNRSCPLATIQRGYWRICGPWRRATTTTLPSSCCSRQAATTAPISSMCSSPSRWASSSSRAAICSCATAMCGCAPPKARSRSMSFIGGSMTPSWTRSPNPQSALVHTRPVVGRQVGQSGACQRARHRRCRRQGDVLLRAAHDRVLSRRARHPQQRAHLYAARPKAAAARVQQSPQSRGQGGARLRRLRHADRAGLDCRGTRGLQAQGDAEPRQLHCPADARALDGSHPDRRRDRAAPCGSQAVRALRQGDERDSRRAHPGSAGQGFARGQFEPGRWHQGHLGARAKLMLSRTAENLFWMARSMERAENTARMLDVSFRMSLLPSTIDKQALHFEPILDIALGSGRRFHELYDELNHETIIRYVALEPEDGGSIWSLIHSARENARAQRTAISNEAWESLNSTL